MDVWEEKVAVIILNYNGAALTIESVKKLQELSNSLQIVVVDNCSTDNSLEMLRTALSEKDHVWLVANPENKGYASGNNVGLRYVAEYLRGVDTAVIMNPDVVITNINILKKMYFALIADSRLAVITTQTIYNDVFRQPNDFGWKHLTKRYMMFGGTLIGRWISPSMRYKVLRPNENMIAYIDSAQGCFFMAKMDVMKGVGYLDEHTFLYGEEIILGKKIQRKGYKEGVLLDEFIHHNHKVKDKHLVNKKNKLFDMRCFYDSRKYYIEYYSDASSVFKVMAKSVLNIDFLLKKLLLLFRKN